MAWTEHNRGRAHGVFGVLFAFAAASVAILWSWNSFAVDILGLPEIRFRHAVALELLVVVLSATTALPRLVQQNTTG